MECPNCKHDFCWVCEGPYNTAKFTEGGLTIYGHCPATCKVTLDKLIAKREKARLYNMSTKELNKSSVEFEAIDLN